VTVATQPLYCLAEIYLRLLRLQNADAGTVTIGTNYRPAIGLALRTGDVDCYVAAANMTILRYNYRMMLWRYAA
jgi:hypothetical protein